MYMGKQEAGLLLSKNAAKRVIFKVKCATMKKFCGDLDIDGEKRNVYIFRYNVPLFYTYQ